MTTSTSFASVVAYLIGIINSIIPVLAALALLLFMWGVFQYIYHSGKRKNRDAIMWGLIALFVLFSIWGILRLLNDSIFGTSSSCNTPGCGAGYYYPGSNSTGAL